MFNVLRASHAEGNENILYQLHWQIRGALETRAQPSRSIFFNFVQFSGKKWP